MSSSTYAAFLDSKTHAGRPNGIPLKSWPDGLFEFQVSLVEWNLAMGRSADFADCGLGKTAIQLTWADNVRRQTNRPILILTPLAVGAQTVSEARKFKIEDVVRSRGEAPDRGSIVVTNYEQLHRFDPVEFGGVVCDESSILKHYRGATQTAVTQFLKKVPYRLLCTATAAPNDYAELGTSSEAIGCLGMVDMLSRFFRQDQQQSAISLAKKGRHDLGHMVAGTSGGWRLKGHAEMPFWRWVATWARAARRPSDLGAFDDTRFVLPELIERHHVVVPKRPRDGMLFTLPAVGLNEEREERRRTLDERCALVASLVDHRDPAVVWCHLNSEGDLLERMIPGAVQVSGSDSDDEKEEAYRAFASGQARVIITKPKIGAWGLNWQHCAHVVTFASHSYEQYYQSVRRCWRFGQTHQVVVDVVSTEGESRVAENMQRKAKQVDEMFTRLVAMMQQGLQVARDEHGLQERMPSWLS